MKSNYTDILAFSNNTISDLLFNLYDVILVWITYE